MIVNWEVIVNAYRQGAAIPISRSPEADQFTLNAGASDLLMRT